MSISVIIPAYNEATHIRRAIRSCLVQPQVTQVIVIDDGSTDGTYAFANSFNDSRLTVLLHPNKGNHGRSASRNRGIHHATKEWIAFCDADDYFRDNRFGHLDLNNTNIDGYYDPIGTHYSNAGIKEIYPDLTTSIGGNIPPHKLANYLISDKINHISLLGMVVRRHAFRDIGVFDETLQVAEDTDLIWRLALEKTVLAGGSSHPVAYRWVDGSNSFLQGQQTIHDKYFFYLKWYQLLSSLDISPKAQKRIKESYRYYKVESKFWKSPKSLKRLIRRFI